MTTHKTLCSLVALAGALLISLAANGQTARQNGGIYLQAVPLNALDSVSKTSYQHITFYGPANSHKYFLDQHDRFLVDFHWLDADFTQVSKVNINVDGYDFELMSLTPFMVWGLSAGEHSIKIKMYNASGTHIPFRHNKSGSLSLKLITKTPLFINDAVVLGILAVILGAVFWTASSKQKGWKKFYTYIPAFFICYFLPSVLNSAGIISGEYSNLYYVASRYLLPASLVLLTLSTDFKGIINLGPKAIIMFLTGTIGIVLGGPLAVIAMTYINPDMLGGQGPDALWKGMATIAGSWIGGGANQAAMLEVFGASGKLFSAMVAVDIIVANIWMAFLLYGAGRPAKVDARLKADATAITELKNKVENYQLSIARMPKLKDTIIILAIGLGATAFSHAGSEVITPVMKGFRKTLESLNLQSLTSGFFWLVVIATAIGLGLSFTRARALEGAGASRIGSVFIYILVATIGMRMDVLAIFENPSYFLMGLIWMAFHAGLLILVGRLIKAPFFFLAVGSQANVGGAASAPIVASAFSPALAPVGVLLAVLGYTLGTYGALLCGIMMQALSNG